MNVLTRFKYQRGFSLLEALIAVLILSIGVLGVTALQYTSKHANHEAIQRLTATNLVREIAERMRLNRGSLATYSGNANIGAPLGAGALVAPTDCIATPCSPGDLALFDLMEWDQALAGVSENRAGVGDVGGLVQPSACILGQDAGIFTIVVAWRGSEAIQNQLPISSDPDLCKRAVVAVAYGAANKFRRHIIEDVYIR